jgi:hypothetical protein
LVKLAYAQCEFKSAVVNNKKTVPMHFRTALCFAAMFCSIAQTNEVLFDFQCEFKLTPTEPFKLSVCAGSKPEKMVSYATEQTVWNLYKHYRLGLPGANQDSTLTGALPVDAKILVTCQFTIQWPERFRHLTAAEKSFLRSQT